QLEIEPRKCDLLSENDINQLFDLNNNMKEKLDKELQYFINEIINNLLAEKYQQPNEIDKLVEKQNTVTNKMKKCLQCFTLDIDNKKRNCPNCNAKLPTLTLINQASSSQQLLELENINKEIIFKPYELKKQNNENLGQRTRPDSCIEQQRFRVYLRKKQFFCLKMNSILTNLDGDINLSEEIKSFSTLAQEKRQMFIKNTLLQQTNTNVWHPIPVTEQEADALKNEKTMRKEELIAIINSVLISLPNSQYTKYTNLKNKSKAVLLKILQEIRDLNSTEETIDEENTINELTDKK
ncbi:39523_t:CDS:2, partial [Gigaspora margarita]